MQETDPTSTRRLGEAGIQNLIRQAQDANPEAFGQIYDIYAQQIYRFLFAKVRHQQTAEDLAHTVFLKAWTNIRSYKPRSSAKFSTWLFQIANFTLIDYWRTHKTTTDITGIENLAQFAADGKLYEKYDYLWNAISTLPLDYQTVLDLRFKQDRTIAETAQIMKKTQVSVRVLQHRALKALRGKLNNIL